MSYPLYADYAPTPAPLTSGSTIQSFVDPQGDVWVAKNGVRSGNWYRARDVIRSHVHRAAAPSWAVVGAALTFDSTSSGSTNAPASLGGGDPYGLYNSATGFVAPVAGLYQWFFSACATATAASQWAQLTAVYNAGATAVAQKRVYAVGATNLTVQVLDSQILGVGDYVWPSIISSVALSGPAQGVLNFGWFQYVGAG